MSTATITPILGYGQQAEGHGFITHKPTVNDSQELRVSTRPILPTWASNRSQRRQAATWAARHAAHTAAYHGIRLPLYGAKLSSYAPLGIYRSVLGTAKWVLDWEARPLRKNAIATLNASEYEKLSQQYRDQRNVKAAMVTVGLAGLAAGGMWLGVDDSTTMQLGLSTLGALGFGAIGRPRDAKVIEPASLPTSAQRLTPDVITKALCSIGIAGIARDAEAISFPSPVARDGQGWRAEVDLPLGVTASEVIARREKLASALGRPLGSVWPETDAQASPARLVLWVGDQDMASMPQSSWPLANANSVDIFDPFTFGEDAQGRAVSLCLAETNMLIGALPGAGKTTSLRQVLLAAALDPRSEIWCWEFKGTGDFSAISRVATRYGSGPDDVTMRSALDGLRALRKECDRRAAVIRELDREHCPEFKVTSAVANTPGLHPLVVAIDEAQCLFQDKQYGKEAGELAEQIIKLGRALGIILIIATQRPDRDSLPTGVAANVGTRLCLRVMDQVANDMILGTSSYQRGIRATLFTHRDRGMGYLVGQHDLPQILRVYNVGIDTAEAVIDRALELRGGQIVSSDIGPKAFTENVTSALLADIASVTEPGERLWYAEILDRLAVCGDRYVDWTGEYLGEQLRAAGVQTRQIGKRADNRTINNKGIRTEDALAALKGEN
jgi:DNA segregation ATPase FtsK/SpoIIIE, S-DNA-T family